MRKIPAQGGNDNENSTLKMRIISALFQGKSVHYLIQKRIVFLVLMCIGLAAKAHMMTPALVEVSIHPKGSVELQITFNMEAFLAGINSDYKNTQDSPNAQRYNELRAMTQQALSDQLTQNEDFFTQQFSLSFDQQTLIFERLKTDIPEIGDLNFPRKTILTYGAAFTQNPKQLLWTYREAFGDNAIRHRIVEKGVYTWQSWQWLRQGEPYQSDIDSVVTDSFWQRVVDFIALGYAHILPKGLDHILFIIGMALLSSRWRVLITLVTAFTLAHTMTLALSMLTIISLPERWVETLIALSIVYVGLECIYFNYGVKLRTAVVFLFGLLHGLGFAGVLGEFEFNSDVFLTTLLSFNIGVELGQISIIIMVLGWRYLMRYMGVNERKYLVMPVAGVISLTGIVWTVERAFYG